MDSVLREKVRELRASYAKYGSAVAAKHALGYARRLLASPSRNFDWEEARDYSEYFVANTHEAPFDVEVAIVADECGDGDQFGDFSDTWAKGCIDLELANGGRYYGRRSYRYFHPASDCKNLDWREMRKLLDQEMSVVDLRVTVSRHGIELAKQYLGGGYMESDTEPGDVFIDMDDTVDEAIEEAGEVLLELCSA